MIEIFYLKSCFCLFQDQRPPEVFTSKLATALFKINVRRNTLPQILLLPFSRSTSAGILYLKSCFCPFQDQRPPEFFTSIQAYALFKINVRRNSLPQFQLLPLSRSTFAGILYLKSCPSPFQDKTPPEFFTSDLSFAYSTPQTASSRPSSPLYRSA